MPLMAPPRLEQPATHAIPDVFLLLCLGCTAASAQPHFPSMIASISATRTQQIRLLVMYTYGLMRSWQQDAILLVLLTITSSQVLQVALNVVSATPGASIVLITNNTPALPVMLQLTDSTRLLATTMSLRATDSTILVLMAITVYKYRWFVRLVQSDVKPVLSTSPGKCQAATLQPQHLLLLTTKTISIVRATRSVNTLLNVTLAIQVIHPSKVLAYLIVDALPTHTQHLLVLSTLPIVTASLTINPLVLLFASSVISNV